MPVLQLSYPWFSSRRCQLWKESVPLQQVELSLASALSFTLRCIRRGPQRWGPCVATHPFPGVSLAQRPSWSLLPVPLHVADCLRKSDFKRSTGPVPGVPLDPLLRRWTQLSELPVPACQALSVLAESVAQHTSWGNLLYDALCALYRYIHTHMYVYMCICMSI